MPRFLRGLVLAGALALTGCGVGGQTAGNTADEPEMTKAQLAVMVLPADALGTSTQGLEPDNDSGVVDNAEAADGSFDPDDTAKTLVGEGRVSGWELGYVHPKLISAKKGVLSVGSSVELLRDPVYAAQYLHARLSEYERFHDSVAGLRLSGYSAFEAAGIGDEAGGERARMAVPGVFSGYVTEVYFRRGDVVGRAAIVRADRQDVHDEVLRLATELDRRVQGVLAGELTPPERPVKPDSADISSAERRALPAQTLAAADLGAGVTAGQERQTDSDEDSVSYLRGFEDVEVGGSHLMRLNAQTTVYEDRDDAALTFKLATKGSGREIFVDAVVRAFAKETGVTPTDVRVRPLPNAGRGMAGMVVTFQLVGARFEMVSIFMRSGKLVQSVTGICRPSSFDPDDMKIVARRAYARMVA